MEQAIVVTRINDLSDLIAALTKTISSIRQLQRQWRVVDLTVLSLEIQLLALRTALSQIQDGMEQSSQFGLPDINNQLVMDLGRCIDCCRLLTTKVNTDVAELEEATAGKLSNKLTLLSKISNLKETQTMIQQQTTALTLYLTVCNSAGVVQQKELLGQPQRSHALDGVESEASSQSIRQEVDMLLASSSSSTISSATTVGSVSRQSSKSGLGKRIFKSNSHESPVRSWSRRVPWGQKAGPEEKNRSSLVGTGEKPTAEPLEGNEKFLTDNFMLNKVEISDKFSVLPADVSDEKCVVDNTTDSRVETNEKFSILPAESSNEKYAIDGAMALPVETREKFTILPPDFPEEKCAVQGTMDLPVESKEKFSRLSLIIPDEKYVVHKPVETEEKFITDESADTPGSSTGTDPSLSLSPQSTLDIPIEEKRRWKSLRIKSPLRKQSESRRRSLAIDNALKREKRKTPHNFNAMLVGSELRLHLMTAAKMRNEENEYKGQELVRYRRSIVWKGVRECTRLLMDEMRHNQVNPGAKYLWAYVDVLEGYYNYDEDAYPIPTEELDDRFFGALEAILQDALVVDLIRRLSEQGGARNRSVERIFASISRISSPDYVPTERDILYASCFTSPREGTASTKVRDGKLTLEFLDIGSLTGTGKKWIRHVDGAQFVIFVVELEQCENPEKMADTMRDLTSAAKSRWFLKATIILMLDVRAAGTPLTPFTPKGERRSGDGDIFDVTKTVVEKFQELKLDRLWIFPCDMLADSRALIQSILGVVDEMSVIDALNDICWE